MATDSRVRAVPELKAEPHKFLFTLRLLRQLVMTDSLTDIGRRVAMGSLIDHAIADITGKPVETDRCLDWAMEKARELGYVVY